MELSDCTSFATEHPICFLASEDDGDGSDPSAVGMLLPEISPRGRSPP